MPVQWFPGHMARAKRRLAGRLPLVDLVLEVADARVPAASRNPDLGSLAKGRRHLLVLNKSDLADPELTRAWLEAFKAQGTAAAAFSALKEGREKLIKYIRDAAQRPAPRRVGPVRVLVAGIPNVGKSALINRLVGRRSARVGARPGITRGEQWVRVTGDLELLDTPGLLWPKLTGAEVGFKLAAVGAIRTEVLPVEEVAAWLAGKLQALRPESMAAAYDAGGAEPAAVLECVARRRGLYVSGGRLDLERAAIIMLADFQQGKLGRITLEAPGEEGGPA